MSERRATPVERPSALPEREAQARAEVGTTEVGRRTAVFLAATFLLAVAGVPLADHLLTARSGDAGAPFGGLARALPEALAVSRTEGLLAADRRLMSRMEAFESDLEDGSRVVRRIQPWVQAVLTGLLGAGNEQVYPGTPGWLFLRSGVDSLLGPGFLDPRRLARRSTEGAGRRPPPQPDPLPALLDLHAQLAARGIELWLLPVPTKAAIEPRRWSAEVEAPPPLVNPSLPEALRRLEAAGVRIFDPAPILVEMAGEPGFREEGVYLPADTHWRPEALERVARELARRVRERLGPPERPEVWTRRPVEVRHDGDLAALLRLPRRVEGRLYPPRPVIVRQVTGADGSFFRPDPAASVLLLGDSFANVFSQEALGWGRGAGLAEQLAYFLGEPVDRVAINGGGATEVRRRLAAEVREGRARGVDRLGPKKLVIYQFAARELAVGSWEKVRLEGDPGQEAPTAAGS